MIGKASEIKTAMFNPEVTDGMPLDCYINLWLEENKDFKIIQIHYSENMVNGLITRQSALIIYKEQ